MTARTVRDPTVAYDKNLAQSLGLVAERMAFGVRVALPGRVVAYDPATRRATVQPMVDMLLDDGTAMPYAPLVDVPVVFPAGGGLFVVLPLAAGDQVLLIVCHRDISGWKTTGDQGPPPTLRKMDPADVVALPGFGAPSARLGGLSLQTEDGSTAVQVEDGAVTITANRVTINYSGGTQEWP